ncbi:hypothetical protein BASA61_002946 [Batrachochytrium salamandrivorans]|nr:hypothetical protein BASA61_002946 [Batrachochytrium salamandrivorans]
MRVDIGIVLSLLSFSVLAKVIPNDDSHGPLLVRRAVGPDTMGLLWKRNNGDDEQGPSPMDSDTGASAGAEAGAETSDSSDDSIPNHPSSSGGLSELDQTPDPTEEPPWSFQEQLLIQRPKYILDSDEESIQKVVKKVTGAFEDEDNQVIPEIEALLTHVLNSARMFLASYESETSTPFFLSTAEDSDHSSLFETMSDIRQYGGNIVKEFLGIVEDIISRIIKKPQDVMKELRKIVNRVAYMRNFTTFLCDSRYMALFSKVETTENEAYVEVTKAYIRQMESDRKLALKLLKKIQGMVDNGGIKLKSMSSRYLALMLDARNHLDIEDGPPTDTTKD